jgi:hypothetical protein
MRLSVHRKMVISLTYSLTYLPIPWSRVLLEKLTVPQLVKKSLAFYGAQEVHYRIHKNLLLVPVWNQIKQLNTLSSYVINIYFKILLSIPRPSIWSLSLRFSHFKDIVRRLLQNWNFGALNGVDKLYLSD